ncbi:GNAT family N-acetyltransferase [Anaerosporomusa subterranea]|uniref:GNAT family N-acetyltransferase n=1 Tax=Anaerosporomusa subterranea TaxID=1794912 RepID=UPI0018D40057|nr:N-acetyltransferase [Anaerosporomusa subterranea]
MRPIRIRPEQNDDYEAITEVHRLAFGRDNEGRLVERLRDAPAYHPGLSLVAVDENRIVGHILFSLIAIESEGNWIPALALAPLAVIPDRQCQGVGAALVEQGILTCHKFGHRIIIVLGHAEYYPHFGFQPASRFGIRCPFPVPDEVFMVLVLSPGVLKAVQGTVVYPELFKEV